MSLQAKQGYVGFLQLESTAGDTGSLSVRVSSCDLKLQQAINYPEVIDGKIDTTLYQLGPKEVGGGLAFPLVHEGAALTNNPKTGTDCSTTSDTLAKKLWKFAAERDGVGRLANRFNAHVRYSDNLAFTYPGCLINSMTFTIAQQAEVSVSADVIGGADSNGIARRSLDTSVSGNLKFLAPARVVTWNDARIGLWDDNGSELVLPAEIREFACTINNGIERYYTLNNRLAPQDIAAKKREISGTLKMMGHSRDLTRYTEANESRYTSSAGLAFGYSIGANSQPYWATGLYGLILTIENVQMSTGLFETDTSWRALGDCENSFLATKLGTSQNIVYPTSSQYGNSTAPDYPDFSNDL